MKFPFPWILTFAFFSIVFCAAFQPFVLGAGREIAVAIHVHSAISSGFKNISEISRAAEKESVDAVIMTDLLYEHYEYGLWPLRSVLKKSFDRNSVLKSGARGYFEAIERSNLENAGVLMIDGTVVTPFYYWSGSPWPGPLVLNHRATDFLVLGLGNPEAYEDLPVVGRKTSRFTTYQGEQGDAPYQDLIDRVGTKGLVYWSHPLAEENYEMSDFLLPKPVFSITKAYPEMLLSTSGYTGYAIYAVGLDSLAHDPNADSLTAPDGIWDRILAQYCRGTRAKPSWVIGEVDYNGRENNRLSAIVNRMNVNELSREEVLQNLARGSYYVITTARDQRHMVLKDFRVEDSAGSAAAGMGGETVLQGSPVLKFTVEVPGAAGVPLHVILIRNGTALHFNDETAPFTQTFRDPEAPVGRKSYYRIIVAAENAGSLISNPVFFTANGSPHEN